MSGVHEQLDAALLENARLRRLAAARNERIEAITASQAHNHVTRDVKPIGECPGCDTRARLLAEISWRDASISLIRGLHVAMPIYDECECDEDAKDEGHVEVTEIGLTCNLLYYICRECCTENPERWPEQAEWCSDKHRHTYGDLDPEHRCPTISALGEVTT